MSSNTWKRRKHKAAQDQADQQGRIGRVADSTFCFVQVKRGGHRPIVADHATPIAWCAMREPGSHFTLLINAGGGSLRMGTDKALLRVSDSGEPLIRHVARRLMPLVDGCIIVANDPAIGEAVAPLGAHWLPDADPNCGPLGGLATGLAQIEDWAICVACDMPFVQPALFRFLCDLALETDDSGQPRWDAVVPYIDGRHQTLHALYHRRCLTPVRDFMRSGRLQMTGFFQQVRVRLVAEGEVHPYDPELWSFFNANTPAEWEQAQRRLRAGRK